MKCPHCSEGELFLDIVSVTIKRENSSVTFQGVPASVCIDCGGYQLSEEMACSLAKMANDHPDEGNDAVYWISADPYDTPETENL